MIPLTAEHYPQEGRVWEALVRIWEDTEAPEGCMVEIIDGVITVAPPRDTLQNVIVCTLQRPLYSVMPDDWGAYQKLGLALPARRGIYVPHLVVAPEAALSVAGYVTPAAAAELVVEITSVTNAVHARTQKRAGYACAGVPLYLLVDKWAPGGPILTLYGEPEGETYRRRSTMKFGEPAHLPDPFGVTIGTDDFLSP
ncbi:Putative restriction endonuclease [Streptomyces sp. 2323.1]|uniref:Uma2 family endonuclease n=1 Tax=Streptomyces sp. 2323.1 TaxID=1938841 RepID=UPI000BC043DC|nr:Uma2 family endonuclease [Streptomyces sp. 2323.1]SOE11600.1 Putative restriction endonuclease [Streptomyces sp. 2323.1]